MPGIYFLLRTKIITTLDTTRVLFVVLIFTIYEERAWLANFRLVPIELRMCGGLSKKTLSHLEPAAELLPWRVSVLVINIVYYFGFAEYQFSSAAQLYLILCDSIDCNTPGFPVLHQLMELAQTHVHQVGDDIQPSHPLSSLLLASLFPTISLFQ